ncbi:hypothetical protein SAMD00019534_094180 [Acytostelium subglobosum LB1]|uniref:hypothetical protein n=1 Tax=Acytostelium subglobosum LB1 TaxID=1410327 RepID=UPI000644920E|nr:hypothetical protein SAMD00019534_094180 [Acytostelium subglobosum LB1]GAM26243.1 hypothetical protein SAMD00019534_094180 [Acytostelium subglobosum LB1]|eukprot:XP_012750797.1 hypothetical protein SAMD00019534_094180 [Acytostelium subglobosum LB1]
MSATFVKSHLVLNNSDNKENIEPSTGLYTPIHSTFNPGSKSSSSSMKKRVPLKDITPQKGSLSPKKIRPSTMTTTTTLTTTTTTSKRSTSGAPIPFSIFSVVTATNNNKANGSGVASIKSIR